MKFIKGMILGGIITTGVAMMCTEGMSETKKKMMKKGRRIKKRYLY